MQYLKTKKVKKVVDSKRKSWYSNTCPQEKGKQIKHKEL
ncbi:hypothetical protein QES_0111 [Clostridioides difficile CD149]|nr:hypothetical protein QAS_0151 [Clostridioides difficile CD9]EQE12739.1 hypothetical protein QAU_0118 [Clostridioides difficile CD13]EQE17213.1 hypothetical protein QAQ_0123 [Clostridioides difficile CD8]EQE23466.1 hypothetical protein QAY_0108 [Clostridioides difficile CD18]EQE25472.1 hypothetical protein QAW_0124 [Clostridioides difficile CD17]EQE29781.1 hypothetical protein QC1_0186 [Clostridioides difficile CD21]EQE35579.1 hypothetical protein QC3_0080 [Clostridioides difficile CD22]EQ